MLAQSERLGRLVEQLLDLSKLESGEVPLRREPVALAPLVSRVMSEIEVARADRDVDVHSDLPEDLPAIEADPERVHQVIFNLVDNAVRFTPERWRGADRGAPPQRVGRGQRRRHRASASPPRRCRGCSSASTASITPARAAKTAAPASGSRSRDRSWRPTAARSGPRASQATAACSPSICRSPCQASAPRHEQEGSVKSATTTVTISAPERYAFLDLTDDLRRAIKDSGVIDGRGDRRSARTRRARC